MPELDLQAAFWSGSGGRNWVSYQEAWDASLAPIEIALLDAALPQPGERVVDIGCGCGATALAVAERVGPAGRVLGVDISPVMLERAGERTPPHLAVDWALADAATHPFPPGAFDLLVSRLGVMFFSDPPAAFAHLRDALRPGGRLAFACFRKPAENPCLLAPPDAAYAAHPEIPRLPKLAPDDPGPFAFADPERVWRILDTAGFVEIRLQPVDLLLDLAAGQGLDAAVETALAVGPASRFVEDHPEALYRSVADAVRARLAAHRQGDTVLLPAAIWVVTARNGV